MRNKDVYSSYQWCLKVIESCVNKSHVNYTQRLLWLFYDQYKDDRNKRTITNTGYSTSALLYERLKIELKQKQYKIDDKFNA